MKKRILAVLLAVCMVISMAPAALAAGSVFTDVDADDWFAEEVEYVYDNGLMNGVGDNKFDPDGNVTRAMMWTTLARLAGEDTSGSDPWWLAGQQWAMEKEISDGTMAADNITREQLVTMLYRYAQYMGYDVSVGENTNILSYTDAFSINDWAFAAMQWGCGAGIINGMGDGSLAPQGYATRAQLAAILYRFVGEVIPDAVSTHTVTFLWNYDDMGIYDVVEVEDGNTVGRLTNPTRSGYTFAGWYTVDGVYFGLNTAVTEDIVVYAKWNVYIPVHYCYFSNWTANSNGTHTGTCVCGETATEACDDKGTNGACSVCGDETVYVAAHSNGLKYETLAEALAVSGTVTLLDDVDLTATINVPAGVTATLNLNGCDVDAVDNKNIALAVYGSLTVKDTSATQDGTIKSGVGTGGNTIDVYGSFTLDSGNIYSKNNAIYANEGAQITINGGTITAETTTPNSAVMYVPNSTDITITGGEMTGYNGILLWDGPTTVTMTGGSITGTGHTAIQTNGSFDDTEISISGTASVTGYWAGIYHPNGGKLTIADNASITGYTGVVLKGGDLTMTGGTITGTGAAQGYAPVAGGWTDTGDGLMIEHYDDSTVEAGYDTPTAVITGGVFNSTYANAVASYANTSNGVTALTGFIAGGTYDEEPASELLAAGYAATANGDGTWTVAATIAEEDVVAKIGASIYDDLQEALNAVKDGETITLIADTTVEAATTAPYGNKYALNMNGGILDGNGNELTMECYGDDYGIMTSGGTIKNLTIEEGCRAIMIMSPTEDVILDNVNIGGDGVLYAINTGEAGADGVDLIVTNSTIKGLTSFSNIESASFTNCTFGQGTYYNNIYGRVLKPYVNTTITNCSFIEHMNLDLSALAQGQKVTIENCTVNGQPVTVGVFTVITNDEQYDTELFTVDLPSWATSLADCVIIDGKIPAVDNASLDAAIQSGATEIALGSGNYIIPDSAQGKTLTIVGNGETVIATQDDGSYEGCDYSLQGSTVTFENVTINTDSSTYTGYARLNATYNNCTINGTYTLYGDSVFNNCTFNVSGDAYNIWTWGAPNATFNNCTFNSDGKALLLYGTVDTKLTVDSCVFNDNGGLTDLKAAIEIGDDYGKSYTLIVNNTVVNGYEINDKGINTGTTLWANKNSMGNDKLNVVIDGVDVY